MPYFQTDDIPQSPDTKPRPHLMLINPIGEVILSDVKSVRIREYFRDMYCKGINRDSKKVWRESLTKLGYTVKNMEQ